MEERMLQLVEKARELCDDESEEWRDVEIRQALEDVI